MRDKLSAFGLLLLVGVAGVCPAAVEYQEGAAIVVPAAACEVAKLAARELQSYVEKATGVRMEIVEEGDAPNAAPQRLYLGATRAARQAGIDAAGLPRDAYHIRTSGDAAYIVGGDRGGDPLNLQTAAGTLLGVYEILDRSLGVRWLWPGQSGEFVPRSVSLRIEDRDETVLPRFRFCGLRTGRAEEVLWMRRMRMHGADGMQYGHSFGAWGEQYFARHPDWFEMDPQGVRHPDKSMCVSNPGLHRQIVENWWARQQARPGVREIVNVCENDGPGACCCPNCLAWDGPQPPWPRPTPYDNVHCVSRRYARFQMEVLKLAREHDPDAEVVGYAYSNIVFAPTGLQLDKQVVMGYVPDVFFPRTPEQQDWVLRQWLGWEEAGATLFLRPNYLLHGYCMPVNWSRQWAEEFQLFAGHGMIGTDFDSLTGMWSTMGLPLYVLGRLHVDPDRPPESVLEEYYSCFGPAGEHVRAYWDYWERYSFEQIDAFKDGLWQYARYPETAARRFAPECFSPAEEILAKATAAAAQDEDARVKVAFLSTGLQHAQLCVEASIAFAQAGDDEARRRAAVEKLAAFRKTITDPMIVNVSDGNDSCRAREANLGWPQ